MAFKRDKPYNNLPLLPPKSDVETKAILKKSISANKALAKLAGSARQLPNPSIFINTIGLQEARASSEIENIITTNDKLYEALSAQKKITDPATKEVLHYQDALWEGYNTIRKKGIFTTNLFIEIVNIIKQNNSGIRTTPGTTISNPATGEIVYTPPQGEKVIRDLLRNLEEYLNLNDEETDPLIKMAVSHYQFESIHPFIDGNGRTGRILNILYLVQNGLLDIPILYLSKYVIEHKKEYYAGLREVTEKGEWEKWILYMLDAIENTAGITQHKIDDMLKLINETGTIIKKKLPQIYSRELLEVIFKLPYCKRQSITEAKIAQLKTAGVYLAQLEDAGILKSIKVGKEKLYMNKRLIEILKR